MSSIFTKIIAGELPCYKIAENEQFLAFLDIRPVAKGHTLVIPKKEVDYIFDLEDTVLQALFTYAKKIARAMDQVIDCERIGITVLGLEVRHAHVHLVPLDSSGVIDFKKERLSFTKEEYETLAAKIAEAL